MTYRVDVQVADVSNLSVENSQTFTALPSVRIVAYANHLEPGVYSLHYLVRYVTPVTFIYPGAEVHLQYAPEEFGRTADSKLVLDEQQISGVL